MRKLSADVSKSLNFGESCFTVLFVLVCHLLVSAQGGDFGLFEGPPNILAKGGESCYQGNLHKCCHKSNSQPHGGDGAFLHICLEYLSEYFSKDDIVGKEHGDHDAHHQEDVCPQGLGTGLHELLVI